MDIDDDNIEQYKIIVIGDANVGKSSIICRFSDNVFRENYINTIGVDFRYKVVTIDGVRVKLQIWDTAGQERFRTITSSYYRGAHGIIVVYSVDDLHSFQSIRSWLTEIDNNVNWPLVKYLVGNKSDLVKERLVQQRQGLDEAECYNVHFIETSAKSAQNVETLFEEIARNIRKMASPSTTMSEQVDINMNAGVKKSGCC